MGGRTKIHGLAYRGNQTLCGKPAGSAHPYTIEADQVTCLRCKANEAWDRFFNDTIRRRGGQ